MATGLINTNNPIIHEKKERRVRHAPETTDENASEPIDQLEIFDILLSQYRSPPNLKTSLKEAGRLVIK
jgi:hypothetical protein